MVTMPPPRRQRRHDRPRPSLDDVAEAIEALHLTIEVSTGLLDDPWFGERARSQGIPEADLPNLMHRQG